MYGNAGISIQPIEAYYFRQDANLCDVPPIIHNEDHDYDPHRMRTIDAISDYEALQYTNFTKL